MRASALRLGLATTGVLALVAGAVAVGGPAQASGRHDKPTKAAEPVPPGAEIVYVDVAGGGSGHGKGKADAKRIKGSTSITVKGGPGGEDVVIGCTTASVDADGGPVPAPSSGRPEKLGKLVASGKAVAGGKAVTGTIVDGKAVAGGDGVAAVPLPKGAEVEGGGGGATATEVAPTAVAGDGSVDLGESFVVEVTEGLDCSAA